MDIIRIFNSHRDYCYWDNTTQYANPISDIKKEVNKCIKEKRKKHSKGIRLFTNSKIYLTKDTKPNVDTNEEEDALDDLKKVC